VVLSNAETLLFHIETAMLIKDVLYRKMSTHLSLLPATIKFCSITSSPILSFHFFILTAQNAVVDNIRFAGQG
jgi:hypothetical protein